MTRIAGAMLCVALAACGERPPRADSASVPPAGAPAGAPAVDTLSGLSPGVPMPVVPETTITIVDSDDLAALGRRLLVPVEGVVAAQLRDTYSEARSGHTHEALDIIAPRGTPVLVAIDGKLTKLHNSVAGGLMVYAADAADRFIFMYGHLDRYADDLKEGMALQRGQVIGYVGTTGNAPAGTPHLHFAVARGTPSVAWWKGTPVNPYSLFVPPSPGAGVESRAQAVIAALAAHDMANLATLVHPARGLRFTPYTRVDTAADLHFTAGQVRELWENSERYLWGAFDGTGDPMRLSFADYYRKFIYDYDFARAPRVAVDAAPMGAGNSINNIRQVYRGGSVIEYHVPGIDPKYGGMDWRSLWLVFEKSGDAWFLTGVIHGSWTI